MDALKPRNEKPTLNNILTLKPKANFYNNWVLPVEKHPIFSKLFWERNPAGQIQRKVLGERDMSDVRNTSLWHKIFKQAEMPSNTLQVPTQFGIVFYFDSDDIPFLCD